MLDCQKAMAAAWLPHCVHNRLPGPDVTLQPRAPYKDAQKNSLLQQVSLLADHVRQSIRNVNRSYAGAP